MERPMNVGVDHATGSGTVERPADDAHPCGSVRVAPLRDLEPGASFRDAASMAVFGDSRFAPVPRTLELWKELCAQVVDTGESATVRRALCTTRRR